MKRRQALGALAGGTLFLLTGCRGRIRPPVRPRPPHEPVPHEPVLPPVRRPPATQQKWVKELGEAVEDLAKDAAQNTLQDVLTQPYPGDESCPTRFPVNCGDYCCYAGTSCCAGTCGTHCSGGGCCPAGKSCCGRYCCGVGYRCCGNYCC